MTAQVTIKSAPVYTTRHLILSSEHGRLSDDEVKVLDKNLSVTSKTWLGLVGRDAACAWGIIPASYLSDQAYLWLWHNELVEAHKFRFVRHSQRVIEVILRQYPLLCGYTKVEYDDSIRWLKWLGAEFGDPHGNLLPFWIRKKHEPV